MPCWTVNSNEVKLAGLNPAFLKTALLQLGFKVNDAKYSKQFDASLTADRFSDDTSVMVKLDGTVTVNVSAWSKTDLTTLQNQVKRAYSTVVVHAAAKKFGWNLKQQAESKFQVQRRF